MLGQKNDVKLVASHTLIYGMIVGFFQNWMDISYIYIHSKSFKYGDDTHFIDIPFDIYTYFQDIPMGNHLTMNPWDPNGCLQGIAAELQTIFDLHEVTRAEARVTCWRISMGALLSGSYMLIF